MNRERIPADVERRVRAAARNRCGYCLSPQHLAMARLEIEHIIPRARGGSDDEENLWLARPICNRHKSDKIAGTDPESGDTVPLFNPCTQAWADHFRWSEDGLRIVGLTPVGRATVEALHLSDDPDALEVRSYWILAGWHPPEERTMGLKFALLHFLYPRRGQLCPYDEIIEAVWGSTDPTHGREHVHELGMLYLRRAEAGGRERAISYLRQALESFTQLGALPDTGRTQTALAHAELCGQIGTTVD